PIVTDPGRRDELSLHVVSRTCIAIFAARVAAAAQSTLDVGTARGLVPHRLDAAVLGDAPAPIAVEWTQPRVRSRRPRDLHRVGVPGVAETKVLHQALLREVRRARVCRSARRRAFSAKAYRPPVSHVRRVFACSVTTARLRRAHVRYRGGRARPPGTGGSEPHRSRG